MRNTRNVLVGSALACLALALAVPASVQAQAFEPNDNIDQASGPLVGGRDYTGQIETVNDVDFFYFNTSGQRQLDMSLVSLNGSGCEAPRLLNLDGEYVEGFSWSNTTARLQYSAPGAEQYLIRVRGNTNCRYRLRIEPPSAVTARAPGVSVFFGSQTDADDTQSLFVDGQLIGTVPGGKAQRFDLGPRTAASRIEIQASNASGDFSWDFEVRNVVGRRATMFLSERQNGGSSDSPRVGVVRRVVISGDGSQLESCGERVATVTCIPLPPVDNDNDGVALPADCDDSSASVRPGVPEVPDNSVDEDCDGVAAQRARHASRVSLSRSGRRYRGRVVSDAPTGCVERRTVKLRRVGGGTRAFGSATTDSRGRFTIRRASRLRGRVYVVVTQRSAGLTVCRNAASRQIRG
jgi:hypothetical protein